MAGSFGFEAEHYDISVKIGDRMLLPAVRAADDETLVIADGFSCREQIADLTGRGALHLRRCSRWPCREGPAGPRIGRRRGGHQPLGKWMPRPSLAATATVAAVGAFVGFTLGYALTRADRHGVDSSNSWGTKYHERIDESRRDQVA